MHKYQHDFIEYALQCGVLKFGEFTLKSGRSSPYFFNTGLFNSGAKLARLGQFYAQAIIQSELEIDILYGPAYKGIPLVCATAIAYAKITGNDIPFAFNRKELKDHGEGGHLVGAVMYGKALILDDVITAGTSVRESVGIIQQAGATPCGVLIALDRQEKGQHDQSAIQEVMKQYAMPVVSIINLANIIAFLETDMGDSNHLESIITYQRRFGI
jgi:orotate phosphoribosyltransferase